ncbi:hypothetical protein ANO14919_090010 [Xylariales sp. No.14919]|nr:hypothetical protein ANO14919_090010 [Xylariales sp. No.14919]
MIRPSPLKPVQSPSSRQSVRSPSPVLSLIGSASTDAFRTTSESSSRNEEIIDAEDGIKDDNWTAQDLVRFRIRF